MSSVVVQIIELLLKIRLTDYIKPHNVLYSKKHGFTEGRLCQTNLNLLDQSGAVHIMYPDFSKAFDRVPHSDLKRKLYKLGLNTWLMEIRLL